MDHLVIDTDEAASQAQASNVIKKPFQSLEIRLGGRRAAIDALLLGIFVIVTLAFAISFDALEMLIEWSEDHEEYEVDEIFSLMILSSIALAAFSIRRMRELRREMVLRDEAETNLRHVAMHDALTGLPNRVMFNRQLEKELARASREHGQVAVLVIDLDRFKMVNDVFGHAVGDELLQVVSDRFINNTRRMDTVARLGGDEFAIIQPLINQPDGAQQLATRLIAALLEPLQLSEQQILSSLSIGIVIGKGNEVPAAELVRNADIALYRAKAEGRSTFRFFEADMDLRIQERQQLESDFREAIENGDLRVHYQPLVKLPERTLMGFEALLRWNHPTRGNVSPVDFIPLAEETGLIVELGDWVVRQACTDALQWSDHHRVAVNLSPAQFRHVELPAKIKATLEATGLAPERLELEVTEGLLIEDSESALALLTELKALGISISMDDFGTGYSSLSYLQKFPFDKIKIDRSFVSQLGDDRDDWAIVNAILALGHSLGMTATAEGVESSDQLKQLNQFGCDQAQGFFLGKPVDQAATMALIAGGETI